MALAPLTQQGTTSSLGAGAVAGSKSSRGLSSSPTATRNARNDGEQRQQQQQPRPGSMTNGVHTEDQPDVEVPALLQNGLNGGSQHDPRTNGVSHGRSGRLQRARTEQDLTREFNEISVDQGAEQNWELRHGWEEQFDSEEYLRVLSQTFYMYYTDKRHESDGHPKESTKPHPPRDWSLRDKTKTVSAALMLCLNLGVDPPDVIKPNPCAVTECWIDPRSQTMSNPKTLEAIGKKLQEHFESLSIKTRYKQHLDPSFEETRRYTAALRKSAKEERVLLYYNGHGVPLPTSSGEIWVFNKDYTQYIPIALYDLQSWMAGPALCIYDCSHAGNIIMRYEEYVKRHERENADAKAKDPNAQVQNYGNNIHLAACGPAEQLPTNPDLPADLFTCCLTTPIDISLRFHVMQNPLHQSIRFEDLTKVPGKASERRSPMGELNWILTAITDTIAWNALPRDLFRKLFRQDLMVAALFRNYLVAERILRAYGCHPATIPKIPSTHEHPLWEAWDLAVEMVVSQLPAMLASAQGGEPYEYKPSNFFGEQLTAFEHYLQQGAPKQELPTQLPVVLQVLLSQAHRLKALVLLSKFLDLGPWAVNLALTIGIFPYVVKLLQSPAVELKPIMIFIWARIIAVAPQEAQNDLLRESGFQYFSNVLVPSYSIPINNLLEHKAMSAFVIAMFCRNFPQAQQVCLSNGLIESCLEHCQNPDNPLLRQWSCLCISMLWKDHPEAKWAGIRCQAHHRLCLLVIDPVPEVRAAAIHASTNFLGIPDLTDAVAQNEEFVASALMVMTTDGNSMVRRELLVFYSKFVKRYHNKFLVAAFETLVEERDHLLDIDASKKEERQRPINGTLAAGSSHATSLKASGDSVQGAMWYQLITATVDCHPEVAQSAAMIVDHVHHALLQSPLAQQTQQMIDQILDLAQARPVVEPRAISAVPITPRAALSSVPNGAPNVAKNEGYLSLGMRRTASVAAALKYLVGGSNPQETGSATMNGHRASPSMTGRPGIPAEWSASPSQDDPMVVPVKAPKGKVPTPRNFHRHPEKEIVDLPLTSTFLEYAVEYFLEPQMKASETDEPGSDDYNQRLWRRVRNEKILSLTQPLKTEAGTKRWDIDAGSLNNGSHPYRMSFHQFEDYLALADERDGISVWNWRDKTRLSRFSNGNPRGTKINEARFINEDDQALLITGSSDGVVKLFRNYDRPSSIELVTTFRALTEMVPSTRNAGLVFDWQQGQGKLLCAGDVKVIRVWNAATELCVNDIPARSGSCITSLTSDRVAGNVFAAGYGDGAVRVFDQRLRPQSAMIKCWREQKQWITDVCMQRGGTRELVSGARNGEVRLWDIRLPSSVGRVQATPLNNSTPSYPSTNSLSDNVGSPQTGTGSIMRTLSLHEHAPVFATGSDTHTLTIFNTNTAFLNTIHPPTPLLSTTASRFAPISCTAFHPHRMVLAAGCVGTGTVGFWTCGSGKGFAD